MVFNYHSAFYICAPRTTALSRPSAHRQGANHATPLFSSSQTLSASRSSASEQIGDVHMQMARHVHAAFFMPVDRQHLEREYIPRHRMHISTPVSRGIPAARRTADRTLRPHGRPSMTRSRISYGRPSAPCLWPDLPPSRTRSYARQGSYAGRHRHCGGYNPASLPCPAPPARSRGGRP